MLTRALKTGKSAAVPLQSTSRLRPQQTSSFSSSSSTSFLFFNKPSADASKLFKDLGEAQATDRLDLVAKIYPSLVKAVAGTSAKSSSVNKTTSDQHARLQETMAFVATTPKFNLLLRMFNDLSSTFGIVPDWKDHHHLLKGMARSGKSSRALKWIETMEETHGVRPTAHEWNIVIGGFRKERDWDGMTLTKEKMLSQGCLPNASTFNALIGARFEASDLSGVRKLQSEMEEAGVSPDVRTETALLSGFIKAGEMGSALEIQQRLMKAVQSNKTGPKIDGAALNALVMFECVDNGFEAGCRRAEEFVKLGLTLNTFTVNTLAKAGISNTMRVKDGEDLIELLEESTRAPADRRTWSIVINGVLGGPDGLQGALKIYQESRDRSIRPDSAMIQSLLDPLLSPSPTPENFIIARDLYEDLTSSSRSNTTAPDSGIYVTLLKACADPTHPDLEYSRTLMADMRERSIRLLPTTVAWHIIALMRAASNYDDAFKAYDAMRALDVTVLDGAAYNSIIMAFTSLDFPLKDNHLAPLAPPSLIMEFLSDMRKSEHPPDAFTYTHLLSYYSRTYNHSATMVAHIHSLIKLDINLDPDTALFNSIMNAYSRVGAFNAAYRIWDSMRSNRGGAGDIDTRSVSIVIDTCGWEEEQAREANSGGSIGIAGAQRADKIWNQLREEKFQLNLICWEAWVECLCRSGRFEEAENVVFEDMSKNGLGTLAEQSTFEILLKFSRRREGMWQRLRTRIQQENLEMFEKIKDVANDTKKQSS